MSAIADFFTEIDRHWKPLEPGKIKLRVIGSGALLLQTDYHRGTKDGDVLESLELTPDIKERLRTLAGRGSDLHKRTQLYLDIVVSGLPFLPHGPKFHPHEPLNEQLKHFEITTLDVVDVVVTKLKRFNSDDAGDVAAMVAKGLAPHKRLVERFLAAVDAFSLDSRAEDLPKIIKNLHKIERDFFRVPESQIELPDWMQ
jgi:hypothetical protein